MKKERWIMTMKENDNSKDGFIPVAEQMRIICKGVEKLVGEEELLCKLERSCRTGKSLTIKL